MIMVIPPKYSIANVMGTLKSKSSSLLRKKYSWLSKVYWKENILWSPGYFVSSVVVDEETIRPLRRTSRTPGFKSTESSVVTTAKRIGPRVLPVDIYRPYPSAF